MSLNPYTFFGDHAALESLTQHGDRLVELAKHIRREPLVVVAEKIWRAGADKKVPCGPKAWDAGVMARVLMLKRLYKNSADRDQLLRSEYKSKKAFGGIFDRHPVADDKIR